MGRAQRLGVWPAHMDVPGTGAWSAPGAWPGHGRPVAKQQLPQHSQRRRSGLVGSERGEGREWGWERGAQGRACGPGCGEPGETRETRGGVSENRGSGWAAAAHAQFEVAMRAGGRVERPLVAALPPTVQLPYP